MASTLPGQRLQVQQSVLDLSRKNSLNACSDALPYAGVEKNALKPPWAVILAHKKPRTKTALLFLLSETVAHLHPRPMNDSQLPHPPLRHTAGNWRNDLPSRSI